MWTILFVFVGLVALLFFSGRHTFWLPSRPASWPRVLMFHQVTDQQPASGMNTPPQKFAQWLELLTRQGYQFCTISELFAAPQDGQKRVAITFDDGFADNYNQAFPLLQQYQAKATIYVATQIAQIERLSVTQMQVMQDSGLIEFGAHTCDHVNLTRLTDDEAMLQIQRSRDEIQIWSNSCHSFAYPFGRFETKHEQMVKQLGFTSAVSTRKAIEPYSAANRFRLPRISTHGKMSTLQMRIALAKGRFRV